MEQDYQQYSPPIGGLTEGADGIRGNQRYEITILNNHPIGLAKSEQGGSDNQFSFTDTDRTVSNALVAGNAQFVSSSTDGDDTLVQYQYLSNTYTVRYTSTNEQHILGSDASVDPFYTLTYQT